ncbi:MAG: ABC transporter ATP-binding protein [Bdellovibrionaceae bacterium]|nr:ABC transporter ATP-binding protein [Pseudobdellovibrionaceae bacterium]
MIITNALDAFWPLLLRQGLDQLEQREPLSTLARTCLIFLTFMVGLALTRYGWRRYFGEFHTFAAETLRQKIFTHLNGLGGSFFQKTSVGELMSLMTTDVQSFRQAIGPGFLIFADGVIIIIFVLPIMIYLNPSWTWKTLIALPLLPFLIWKVMRLIHSTYKIQQDRFAELTGFCHETVGGIRVLKGFAREENRSAEFKDLNNKYIKAANKNALVDSFFAPVMEFGVASGSVILLFISMSDILSGAVSIGTFVAYHRYIQKMVWPMTALGFGLSFFQKGLASFSRIKEILTSESDVVDHGQREIQEFESLEFRNVSFRYPGSEHWILKNVSFRLEKGQSLAIVGPIGAGKSTLFHILTRLFPLEKGEILVNGIPWTELSLTSLRNIIRLVPQDPFLYSRSVQENLALEGHLTAQAELERAADQAQVLHEIESLPQSWLSQLGEKGVNLSGGQKQRLTLARALLSPAQVLLFDDVLSAVDTITEEKIETKILQNSKQTLIVAAHRLSTVKNLSQVLVLNLGEVEYFGGWQNSGQSPTLRKISQLQESRGRE